MKKKVFNVKPMTTRPKAAKVSNVTTRSQTRTKNTTNFLTTPDPIGFYLENADKRNLRLLSKESNQAFFDNLKCADAQELQEELQAMRNEPEPCKNTAKVIYNPKKGMQRAIMCAIMSTGQLHVYVNTGDLETFLASESVKCFDKNYELKLTLLYPTQEGPPPKPKLYCRGGFHALRLHCVDAQELEAMRQSTSLECKNFSTRMWYNPDENLQHAIMCAIISESQRLHMYVNQGHLAKFLSSESVKCFDNNYYMRLTLLCGGDPQGVLQPEELHCHGGFRALKGGWARDGRLRDQEGVEVVRFTGNTQVAELAFWENESLMELVDVNTIEVIAKGAFRSCRSLTQLGDMRALTTIGNLAFAKTQLTQLGDLSSLTTIKIGAFFECTSLTKVGDLSSLTTISEGAFFGCTSLTKVGDMPALRTIGDGAFDRCTSLTKVGDMPALRIIGLGAFEGTQLTQLENMSNLRLIGRRAFYSTPFTQLGDMPALTTIGARAFYSTQLEKLGGLPALRRIGAWAFYSTQLEKLGDMPALTTIHAHAFHGTPLEQLGKMPALTTIGQYAFEGYGELQTLCLPKSLDTVEKEAFEGCPLKKLSVEPGAEFDCYCENLARKLRLLDGVSVTGDGDPYRVRAGPHDVVFAPSHGSKNDGMM